MSASSKEEFEITHERFLCAEITDRPMLFEVFTESQEEGKALEAIMHLDINITGQAVRIARQILEPKMTNTLKNLVFTPKH